jgi:flagellar basal-body rod protein FlgB
MLENLGGITAQLMKLSLDASLLRHQVIANNIANVDTPGFSARQVRFETQLAGYMQAMQEGNDVKMREELNAVKVLLNSEQAITQLSGELVSLDQQMVELAENVLHYRALLAANAKRGELLGMAVNEGRQ